MSKCFQPRIEAYFGDICRRVGQTRQEPDKVQCFAKYIGAESFLMSRKNFNPHTSYFVVFYFLQKIDRKIRKITHCGYKFKHDIRIYILPHCTKQICSIVKYRIHYESNWQQNVLGSHPPSDRKLVKPTFNLECRDLTCSIPITL